MAEFLLHMARLDKNHCPLLILEELVYDNESTLISLAAAKFRLILQLSLYMYIMS